jgi:hypothetical protein
LVGRAADGVGVAVVLNAVSRSSDI